MEKHSEIVSGLIKRKKPTLPENFFKSFPADLSAQLKDLSEGISPDFEKIQKPAVPDGFFENFHENLKAEIDAENEFSELNLVKRQKPAFPENFENDFTSGLMEKIRSESSRGRVLKLSLWSFTAIAASLLLLFTIQLNKKVIENPVTETQPAVQDDEALEPYVAYLDEESVIDYIIENDIQVGENETSDEIYDYVDSEIEDVYLDL